MMTVSHPDPIELARFVRGDLVSRDNRRLVRYLLTTWRTCCGERENLWTEGARPAGCEYASAFAGGFALLAERARHLAAERARVPELVTRLRSLEPERQRALVRSDSELWSWSLCEWLIEECLRLSGSDLNLAEDLANLTVVVSEELSPGLYGIALINDLKARAWGCVGEVLRLLSDLRSADDAFDWAESFAAEGTGDALEEARVLEGKAALRRDQHRFAEAHRLLDEVVAIYRQYRDFHLVGRAFVQKGEVYGAAGDLEPAIRWLRKGLGLIDSTRERRLELAARNSLMLYLQESGRHQEAWFLLKASRPEFVEHGGEMLKLRLRWLEGRILQTLGLPGEAEAALVEAREGFIAQGAGFSAASVSLDLAGLYASQGRAAEMRRLAEEMLPIFRSRDIHREAIAALIVFQQAVRLEKMNVNLLAEISSYLKRARNDPKLRFEYPV
jgi:tetratricopeptide (TPR) repeat protein